MKNILIVTYLPLHKEPRVLRQIQALKRYYKIATIGYTRINDDDIIYYPIKISARRSLFQKMCLLPSLLFCPKNYIKKAMVHRIAPKDILTQNIIVPDVIIAHDWEGLYLASELKKKHNWNAKVYFDAHEYGPNQFNASPKWRLMIKPLANYSLKKCRPDIAAMSTVCEGIAREYEKYFGFSNGFVKVITNASEYQSTLKPREVQGDKIRLIHHGNASRLRKLELMIKMMKYLDPEKYELTFMLIKLEPDYYDYLLRLSEQFNNIRFIEPVPFYEITNTINDYDIGVFLLLPEHFNYKHALPNKLFEFIQARLAIAISPSIEMVKIVNRYELGIHSKDFSPKSLAKSIAKLSPEMIMKYKKNSDRYAVELSADENLIAIRNIIAELAGD
jgi:glycosyltransferase involved in cell wall biosynthesis